MADPTRRRWIRWGLLALTVLLWAGWIAWAVVPAWISDPVYLASAKHRRLDRDTWEVAYCAGWLTRHVRKHGELPDELPSNPHAAGNRAVIRACPETLGELVRCDADWIYCEADGAVRALACEVGGVREFGGANTPSLIPDPPPHLRP